MNLVVNRPGEKFLISCLTSLSSPIFFTVLFFQRSNKKKSNAKTAIAASANKNSLY
jgi:hypothetical protein